MFLKSVRKFSSLMSKELRFGEYLVRYNIQYYKKAKATVFWGHTIWGNANTEKLELSTFFNNLEQQPVNIVFYSLPPRGGSMRLKPASDPYSYASCANCLVNFVKTLQDKEEALAGPIILGGSSFSAAVSLWATAKYPGVADGLILNLLPDAWDLRSEAVLGYKQLLSNFINNGVSNALTHWELSELERVKNNPEKVAKVRRKFTNLRSIPEKELILLTSSMIASDFPDKNSLKNVTIPVAMTAYNIPAHGVATSEEVRRNLSQATLDIASHSNQIDLYLFQNFNNIIDKLVSKKIIHKL